MRAVRPAQLTSVAAKHPERFLLRVANRQFRTLEKRGGQCEGIGHIGGTSTANWKQQTAIVVTDRRETAVVTDERPAEGGQSGSDIGKQNGIGIPVSRAMVSASK